MLKQTFVMLGLGCLLLNILLSGCGSKSNSNNSNSEENSSTQKIEEDTIVEITDHFIESISKYDYVDKFSEGLAYFNKNGECGFINTKGDEVILCECDRAVSFHNGLAVIVKDGKFGVINKKGEQIVPCIYDMVDSYESDLAIACQNGLYGFINQQGETIIPIIYNSVEEFSEGLAPVEKDGKWGVINNRGETVIPFIYSDINNFSDGLAPAEIENKWGYINIKGEKVIPFVYDKTYVFSEGIARVERDWKYGYINIQGQEITPIKYNMGGAFSDGMTSVICGDWDEGMYHGFINKKGVEVIPCIYESSGEIFSEGLAPVMKNGKWGYINSQNDLIIPFTYDYATDFSQGVAVVQKNGVYGFVDKNGKDTFYGEGYVKKAEEKIKEEEERIAEERRIEQEEREREAHPSIVFNDMVKDMAWILKGTMSTYQGQTHRIEEVEEILIFYPSDEHSGRAARIRWADNRRTYYPQFSTSQAKYKIQSNTVFLSNYSQSMVERDEELPFLIVYKNGTIYLKFGTNMYSPIPKTEDLIPANLNH